MISGLDSAFPPTAAQARAAAAAGLGIWNGYLSEIPQHDGIYRPWSKAEFDVVRVINPRPIAFFSGWDDPAAIKQTGIDWNVRPCLDVERLIRDDGPWVQGYLDASQAGLYGVRSVHDGRRAAFHIAALYPTPLVDPRTVWPASWPRPTTPIGWQFYNTHTEFGVGVDRGWYDDFFGGGRKVLTEQEKYAWVRLAYLAALGREPESAAVQADQASHIANDGSNLDVFLTGIADSPEAQAYRARLAKAGTAPGLPSGSKLTVTVD